MTILVAGASESVGDQQIEKRKKKERVAITLFSSLTTSCSARQYEGFFFFFLVGPKYLTKTQKILSSHHDPLDRQELIQPSFLNFHIQHCGLTMWSSYR